jgi:hypothetical protein
MPKPRRTGGRRIDETPSDNHLIIQATYPEGVLMFVTDDLESIPPGATDVKINKWQEWLESDELKCQTLQAYL